MSYNIVAGIITLYTREIELTFKRYVISSTTRPLSGGFFVIRGTRNEFIYIF